MAATEDYATASGSVAIPPGRRRPASDASDRRYQRPGTIKQTLAAETRRLYAGDWARFQKFCAEREEQALPAAPDLVAAFLAASRCGRTALSRRLAAIDHQHRQQDLGAPGADPSLRTACGRRPARRYASACPPRRR